MIAVKVLGIGKRTTAKDAKGKEYEFVPLSIAYKDDSMSAGYRADTIAVNPGKIPAELTVGEKISMDLYRFRGKMRIRSIGE